MDDAATSALEAFLHADARSALLRPFGAGRIHDTWAVYAERGAANETVPVGNAPTQRDPAYLLQRINRNVFRDYERLMANADLVTRHLDSPVRFEHTTHDLPYYRDEGGDVWRVMRFVPNSMPVPVPTGPEQAREAAVAYGEFAVGLSSLSPSSVEPTIPDFHNTPLRLERLRRASQEPAGSAKATGRTDAPRGTGVDGRTRAREAASWLLEREDLAAFATRGLSSGRIPLRVCHNDAKADNVLVDRDTGRRLCVVDLDTVMPGSLLYDVGDLLRSAAATVGEDDPDLSRVGVRWRCAEAIVEGFAEAAAEILTTDERRYLEASGWLLATEQATRYLTDYLEGDHYYRVAYPEQNLDRVRNQIALAYAFEREGWCPVE